MRIPLHCGDSAVVFFLTKCNEKCRKNRKWKWIKTIMVFQLVMAIVLTSLPTSFLA